MKSIAMFVLCTLIGTRAAAAPVLDRAFTRFGGYASVAFGYFQAQTFAVRHTGEMNRVEVALAKGSGDGSSVSLRVVRIRDGAPSLSPEDLLGGASASLHDSTYEPVDTSPLNFAGFSWVPVITPDIRVQKDDRLAIVLSSTLGASLTWAVNFHEDYPDGSGFWGPPDALVHPSNSYQPYYNYLFRIYVTPVPEPRTTVAALVSCNAFVFLVGRRTRASSVIASVG